MSVLRSLFAAPEHPRAAARSAGAFLLVGAAFLTLFTVLLPDWDGGRPEIMAVVVALFTSLGVRGWFFPHTMTPAEMALLPPLVTCVVAAQNAVTLDATAGAQMFLLWPLAYAALFLNVPQTALTLGTVIVADLLSVTHTVSLDAALADVASVAVAFTGTAIVVHSLRRRLSAILAESERHAQQDHLTGLPNRRAFSAALEGALAHRTRTNEPLSLVTVDVDDFKHVNDSRGHAGGDAVLRQVTAALRTCVRRGGDIVARLGGDEFVALLQGCDQQAATRLAEQIREEVTQRTDGVKVSIGVATLTDGMVTPDAVMRASDSALYVAKASGRDCVSAALVD